jgi:hypothetical protein
MRILATIAFMDPLLKYFHTPTRKDPTTSLEHQPSLDELHTHIH